MKRVSLSVRWVVNGIEPFPKSANSSSTWHAETTLQIPLYMPPLRINNQMEIYSSASFVGDKLQRPTFNIFLVRTSPSTWASRVLLNYVGFDFFPLNNRAIIFWKIYIYNLIFFRKYYTVCILSTPLRVVFTYNIHVVHHTPYDSVTVIATVSWV